VHYKSQPEIKTPRKTQKSTNVESLTKKCDFGRCLDLTGSATARMWSGRAFQVAGPACDVYVSQASEFCPEGLSWGSLRGVCSWGSSPEVLRELCSGAEEFVRGESGGGMERKKMGGDRPILKYSHRQTKS